MRSQLQELSVSLDQYLARRLGPGSGARMARNMVSRSFGAHSFRAFWRYWNAGFNYYLLFYCYRLVRRFTNHGVALFLTFIACGIAHDIVFVLPISLMAGSTRPFPFMTVWFGVISICILISERFHFEFGALAFRYRVALHTAFLLVTFSVTLFLEKL